MPPRPRSPLPLDAATTARLSAQRRRDTKPELALRRAAHALGLRYSVDAALPLPGVRRRADMVFPTERVAVFVDGCAWHSCPDHPMRPKNNADWWVAKLNANVQRDRDTDRRLKETGWATFRVWEHEDPLNAAKRLRQLVNLRRLASQAGSGE